jgi:predicted XRE-type DNA-binding protein
VSLSTIKERDSFDDWISQAEAARLRCVSRQAIAKLIQRKRLSSREIAGRIVVRRSEVEAFVPQPIGRPRKGTSSEQDVTEDGSRE